MQSGGPPASSGLLDLPPPSARRPVMRDDETGADYISVCQYVVGDVAQMVITKSCDDNTASRRDPLRSPISFEVARVAPIGSAARHS